MVSGSTRRTDSFSTIDEVLPLTSKSIEILLLLLENEGSVLEKDELMSRVWPDSFVEEANLAHHVYLLRKALGDGANGTRFIQTIPRRGYRFVAEVKKTVNGGETDGSKTSQAKPLSSKELNQGPPAHDSGSPQSPVDIPPIPKPFNGDWQLRRNVSWQHGTPDKENVRAAESGVSPRTAALSTVLCGHPLPTDIRNGRGSCFQI